MLMGSVVLLIGAFSLLAIQVSCTPQVVAQQPTNSLTQLNKVVFIKNILQTGNIGSERTIWMINLDGTGQIQVTLSPALPANSTITRVRLTPDGNKLVYDVSISNNPIAGNATQNQSVIYTCNINGTNNAPLLQGPQNQIPLTPGATSFELMDTR